MNIKSFFKNKRICLTVAVCLLSVAVIAVTLWLNGLYEKDKSPLFGIKINGGESVSFYHNETDGVYYAFLPAYTSFDSSSFVLDGGATLSFDGKKALNGGALSGIVPNKSYAFSLKNGGKTRSGNFIMKLSENLPAVFIDTASGSMDRVNGDKNYTEQGSVRIINSDGTENYSGFLEYIKGRGNSSWSAPKKPYQIRLDKTGNLLEMGGAKNWILTANYNDLSNLRNKIVFDCAENIGLKYTPDARFADLYLNGEYAGLYLLSEKIEIGENRVDITDLAEKNRGANTNNPENYKTLKETSNRNSVKMWKNLPNFPSDISGGYLLELDLPERLEENSGGYITQKGQAIAIKSPEYPSREEVDYISEILQEFEDALYAEEGVNPSTGKHFYEYIDMESWVKKYLIEEVFQNIDGGISSQFFYKDAGDAKLYAGPVWDYDLSLGNSGFDTTLFCNKQYRGGGLYNRWLSALYSHPEFYGELVKCYGEEFAPYLKDLSKGGFEEYQKEIIASADMDKVRWNRSEEEILKDRELLKNFIADREKFLTDLWVNGSEYCDITAIPPEEDARLCYFSVKKGEAIQDDIRSIFEQFDWFYKDTDKPFDLSSVITEDTVIYAKIKA